MGSCRDTLTISRQMKLSPPATSFPGMVHPWGNLMTLPSNTRIWVKPNISVFQKSKAAFFVCFSFTSVL